MHVLFDSSKGRTVLPKLLRPIGKILLRESIALLVVAHIQCRLWDDSPTKSIYHCADCGVCRVGKGLGKDFFHCKVHLLLLPD
jgi:hypothetical protein